ncbi:sugar transferase [Robertkochia sediminum]|uniref:sugar transferase n=1 Tax=Robertkochia sediminum TaxID=2785326 RepID=UPI001932D0AF|nr:sugar transferase [Robertkochia sediminum]MBL7474053.1 sugar transferase [Robertkochia sediminum]
MYRSFFKRSFDLLLAVSLIILFSPVIITVTLILWKTAHKKPFFFQERPGRYEKIFRIVKFKTMNDQTDVDGNLLPDAERLTSVGAFLRKTSLDELPQLFNVVKGEMSFIGPRPLLKRYLPYYTAQERLRHSVRPGITGLAQVSGRNFLPWNERLQMDVDYVQSMSLVNDLRIILLTVKNVVSRKDIEVVPDSKMLDLETYRKQGSRNYFVG